MNPAPGDAFAIARPPGWRSVDLLSGDSGFVPEGPLAYALAVAARGSEQARLLMLRALVALSDADEPLAAGLSVMIADRSAPVSSAPLHGDAFEDAEVAAVSLPVGRGLRVRRVAPAVLAAGAAPVNVLRVQYLIEAESGLLTITFTTPQAERTEEWELLFDALADTAVATA